MSFAAFSGGSTCWDLSSLGRAVRLLANEGSGTDACDVRDERRHRPIEVLEESVRPCPSEGCHSWRLTSEVLPDACSSPLRTPRGVQVARELRISVGVSFNGEPPVDLAETLEYLRQRLDILQPEDQLSLCWLESGVRASLPYGEPAEQPYVASIILGPRVMLKLRRMSDNTLAIQSVEGGPEDVDKVAGKRFRAALEEYLQRKFEEEARKSHTEDVHKLAKEKITFVFGKVMRSSEEPTVVVKDWDAESESIVIMKLLHQWMHDLRVRPWLWQRLWLEIAGDGARALLGPERSRAEAAAVGKMWKHAISTLAYKEEASRAMFHSCDLRGRGFVDWENFREFARRTVHLVGLEHMWSDDAARSVFNACDRNGDKTLDEHEWLALFRWSGLQKRSSPSERRISAILQDRSLLAVRTTTTVQGDVDLGVACGAGHVIRPLRLRPWGKELAEHWFLGAGFRCAEADDPIAFAAAWRQRCTRCKHVDSQASFIVACGICGDSFGSGWWCTGCVVEAGKPCDPQGLARAVRCRGGDGTCLCCEQPGRLLCGPKDCTQRLCGEHAADKLLEDAAHAAAAGGRDAPEGRSVALRVRLRLRGPIPRPEEPGEGMGVSRSVGSGEAAPVYSDDPYYIEEAYARSLENDIAEVLSLEGTMPGRGQFEVDEVEVDASGGVAIRLSIARAHGRPSPYELFLRLRGMAVDLDGPMYSTSHKALCTLCSTPVLTDMLCCEQPELTHFTSKVMQLADEDRPRIASSGTSLTIWPQTVQSRTAGFVVQCSRPPENCGKLMAYVLAYPIGTRRMVPPFHEFVEHFEQFQCCSRPAPSPSRTRPGGFKYAPKPGSAKTKLAAAVSRHKQQKGGRGGMQQVRSFCQPDAGCMVALGPGPGPSDLLHGEATVLGLQPEMSYDIFLALFAVRYRKEDLQHLEVAYQEPIATAHRVIKTAVEEPLRLFGADESDHTVHILTEQLGFSRRHCMLDLLGLTGLPLIIDRKSMAFSCKPADPTDKNREALKEHSIHATLDHASEETAGRKGGWRLPSPCLRAEPSYRERECVMEISASAEVAVVPCTEHLEGGGLALLPSALTVGNVSTKARCFGHGERCQACRWMKLERSYQLKVHVFVDIVRMAELGEWKSVQKRIDIVVPADARLAIATMLAARPRLHVDHVMRVFEGSVGHGAEVDFPVRSDGATALHVAVEEGDVGFVRALLKRRLDPSAFNHAGETPLHSAARGGGPSAPLLADALIASARSVWRGEECLSADTGAARQALLDHQDKTGRTVLHIAAAHDNVPLVSFLLEARASPSLRDKSGCNVLQAAVAANSQSCAAQLLKVPGVTVNNQTTEIRGCTSLQLACERCHCSLAMALLDCGADPKKAAQSENKAKQAINFLLEGAAKGVRLEALKDFEALGHKLIQEGNPTTEMITLAGAAACDFAMRPSANAEVIATCDSLLHQLGSLHQARSPDWPATLGKAMLTAVQRILTKDANTDRSDDNRVLHAQTPGAWISNLCEVVEFALRAGANPNAMTQDKQQDTALTMLFRYPFMHRVLPNDRAAGEAISKAIQVLLKYNGNPNCGNREGERPATLAKQLVDMGALYGRAWKQLLAKDEADSLVPRPSSKASGDFGPTRSLPERTSQVSLPLLSPQRAQLLRRSSSSAVPTLSSLKLPLNISTSIPEHGGSKLPLNVSCSIPEYGGDGQGRASGTSSGHGSARTQDGVVQLPSLLPNMSFLAVAAGSSPPGLKKSSSTLNQVRGSPRTELTKSNRNSIPLRGSLFGGRSATVDLNSSLDLGRAGGRSGSRRRTSLT